MAFHDVLYAAEAGVGVITLNRPAFRNAQSYRMLDEIDAAFDLARADEQVRVVVMRGAGGVFSTGHDLGTPDGNEYRAALGAKPGVQTYDQFKKYNLDLLLKWRNFPKPTIAMVEGYCIYAGWMLAAAMDVVFAAEDAEFLPGFVEYMSIPWDVGIKKAKELLEAVAVHRVPEEGTVATHVDQFFVLQLVEVMRKRGGGDFEPLADRTDHHPLAVSGEEQTQDPQPRLGTQGGEHIRIARGALGIGLWFQRASSDYSIDREPQVDRPPTAPTRRRMLRHDGRTG